MAKKKGCFADDDDEYDDLFPLKSGADNPELRRNTACYINTYITACRIQNRIRRIKRPVFWRLPAPKEPISRRLAPLLLGTDRNNVSNAPSVTARTSRVTLIGVESRSALFVSYLMYPCMCRSSSRQGLCHKSWARYGMLLILYSHATFAYYDVWCRQLVRVVVSSEGVTRGSENMKQFCAEVSWKENNFLNPFRYTDSKSEQRKSRDSTVYWILSESRALFLILFLSLVFLFNHKLIKVLLLICRSHSHLNNFITSDRLFYIHMFCIQRELYCNTFSYTIDTDCVTLVRNRLLECKALLEPEYWTDLPTGKASIDKINFCKLRPLLRVPLVSWRYRPYSFILGIWSPWTTEI
jgi:hypothetical protein